MQEIFTRFARAPLSRIFFTAKGSFPYGCNNHMVVDQTWSRKLVAVTRFIACYSQKKVDVNKSKTNLSNCVLCNFHHILKKSYNIQYISNYKIWNFPLSTSNSRFHWWSFNLASLRNISTVTSGYLERNLTRGSLKGLPACRKIHHDW